MKLTRREEQVLARAAKGEKRSAIAARLAISSSTVGFHLGNIFRKSRVNTVVQAALLHLRK